MKYELRTSVWRCGGWGEEGVTALRTGEPTKMRGLRGGMCCLGQFAAQVIPEVDLLALKKSYGPEGLACQLKSVYDPLFIEKDPACSGDNSLPPPGWDIGYLSTDLAKQLLKANDDRFTSLQEKVDLIRAKITEAGHEFVLIDDLNLGLQ